MYFTGQNLPLPRRPFPFNLTSQVLPARVPDCHLDRTVIPCLPSYDSLGVFHNITNRFLASFARMVSRSDNVSCMATTSQTLVLFPRILTQGRLHCTQHTILRTALQVLFPARTRWDPARDSTPRRTIPGLHGKRVVCSMPLGRARNP